jgi:hypothetical protein
MVAIRVRPDEGIALRHAALIAGLGLLAMSVLAPVAFFAVFPRLIVADAARSAQLIAGHQGLFLAGIACDLVTFIADVVVAWALYALLRPVQPAVSMLAAWFRLVYATVAIVALTRLVTVLRLVRTPDYANTFGAPQRDAQVDLLLSSFRWEWGVSMLFFAVHLLLLGALVWRSRYLPRVLGVLLVVNGIAYGIDCVKPYVAPGVRLPWLPVLFFGEILFMLWLLVRGRRLDAAAAAAGR